MSTLIYKIRSWLKRNKDYLEKNESRFRIVVDLTEDSSRALFDAYKKRIKILKQMDRIRDKALLFERATHFGYKGSFSAPDSVMLNFLKKKKVHTIFYESEEEELANVLEERRERLRKELNNLNYNQHVTKEISKRNKKFIDFVPPTYRDVYGDRLVFAVHKADIDLAIESGDIGEYYENEERRRHAISGIACTRRNVEFIAEKILSKINETMNRLTPAQVRAGYSIYVIPTFKGEHADVENELVMATKSMKGTNFDPISLQTIINTIMDSSPMDKTVNVDSYLLYLYTIKVIISKNDDKGGCASRETIQTIQSLKKEGITIKRVSPKSTGDNCLIACFNTFYGIKGNVLKQLMLDRN